MLEIENLVTRYRVTKEEEKKSIDAVDDVTFSVDEGEIFGLVGESGCGKSTIAQSIMGILPSNGLIADGQIRFQGRDLAGLSEDELRELRWEEIALISQSAMNAFDPVYTVGEQIREAIEVHRDMPRGEMDRRIADLFETVGIDPERAEDYPHQFSGGMKQRAMIAMALVLEPDLIIADEPTTALDVISQDTILHYLEELQEETGAAVLLITHDMSVVAELCDRTGVMYAGKLAETGPTENVFLEPLHPYAMGLKHAFPSTTDRDEELVSIPGSPPELLEITDGCRFASRCPFAVEDCESITPEMESYGDPDHEAACIRIGELGADELRRRAADASTWREDSPASAVGDHDSAFGSTEESQ
jgi:oligopeptide/dipeptide ABC transporter ATP-binding protein